MKNSQTEIIQLATYADQQAYPHRDSLQGDLGSAALQLAHGQSVVTEAESYTGETELVEHTPAKYSEFLEEADSDTKEDIAYVAEKSRAYEAYRWSMEDILDGYDASAHVLGRGTQGIAYYFEQDGQEHVLKRGGVQYGWVKAFRRGEGIDNVSHLTAVNLEEDAAILTFVPGKTTDSLSLEEKEVIPDRDISELIHKVGQMHKAGLALDIIEQGNVLYDRTRGFGLIDYTAHELDKSQAALQIVALGGVLVTSRVNEGRPPEGTADHAAYMLKQEEQKVVFMNRFLDILERECPEVVASAAEAQQLENAKPSTTSWGGALYDVYTLPHGKVFDEFRDRVTKLGLEGRQPDESLAAAIEYERSRWQSATD